MKSFLKYTLATITGIIIASVLFFIVMLASFSAIVSSGNKPVSISNNSILVLKAGVTIPDRGDQNPLAGIDLFNLTLSPAPGLNEILNKKD
jgi:protease-4